MRRPESVHDIHIPQSGKLCGQFRIILLLTLEKTYIFTQRHFPRSDIQPGKGIGDKAHGHPEQFAQAGGHRLQGKSLIKLPFHRPSEMGQRDNASPSVQGKTYGGQHGADTFIAADHPILHGDIEIQAHDHALAGEVDIIHGKSFHGVS